MRLRYNPRHLGDREQAWKSFLTGSLTASSAIFLVLTDNLLVCIASLVMMAAGFFGFLHTNMNFAKVVYLAQNFMMAGIGLAVTLAFYVLGYLFPYFAVAFILVLVTWLHGFQTTGKKTKSPKA